MNKQYYGMDYKFPTKYIATRFDFIYSLLMDADTYLVSKRTGLTS